MFFPYKDEPRPEEYTPWVTWTLIALNVTVFVMLSSDPHYNRIVRHYGFTPMVFRPATLLTSLFLHGSWLHLLGNMWFLHLFGNNVERRCGPLKYLLAYLLAGVIGSLTEWFFFPNSPLPSIGASGAIAGILGLYLFFFPGNRVKIFYFVFILIGVVAIRAFWVIGIWFGLELLYGQAQTATGLEGGVAHLAHAGGFVAGLVLAGLWRGLHLVPLDGRDLGSQITGWFGAQPERPEAEEDAPVEVPYELWGAPAKPPESDPHAEILGLLAKNRLHEAALVWNAYAQTHPDGVLPPQAQLQLALALDHQDQRPQARDAYERLLRHYPGAPAAADASVALAGMLLQDLKDTGNTEDLPRLKELLARAAQTHPEAGRRALAARWLEHFKGSH